MDSGLQSLTIIMRFALAVESLRAMAQRSASSDTAARLRSRRPVGALLASAFVFGVAASACGAPDTVIIQRGRDPNRPGADSENGVLPGGESGGGPLTGTRPTSCRRAMDEERVTPGAGAETFTLRWDTDHYVLVYSDTSSGAGDIAVVLLDPNGRRQSEPVVLDRTPGVSRIPTLARYDDGSYVVVWEDEAGGKTVRAARFGADGRPIGSPTQIAASAAQEARPVVARAFGNTYVTWMDVVSGTSVSWVAALDDNLAVRSDIRQMRLGTNAAAEFPWISGAGDSLAAVYSDARTGNYNMRLARLDRDLRVQSDTEVRSATGDAILGRLITTDFGFVAAWEDSRTGGNEIYMGLTNREGQEVRGGLVEEPNTGDANWPNMAWNGAATAIVYYQFRDGAPQIFVTFVDANGARVGNKADLRISDTLRGELARYPDIQWNGTDFGVAWVDTRDGAPQIYFTRVRCDG